MAQAFFDAGQDGLFVPGLHIDHAVRRKTGLGQRRGEEVGTCDAPKNLALGARGNTRCKERGGRAVDCAVTAAGDLVQGSQRQSLAGESRVHVGDSEWKHRFHAPASAFDLLDLCAQ